MIRSKITNIFPHTCTRFILIYGAEVASSPERRVRFSSDVRSDRRFDPCRYVCVRIHASTTHYKHIKISTHLAQSIMNNSRESFNNTTVFRMYWFRYRQEADPTATVRASRSDRILFTQRMAVFGQVRDRLFVCACCEHTAQLSSLKSWSFGHRSEFGPHYSYWSSSVAAARHRSRPAWCRQHQPSVWLPSNTMR